MTPDTPSSPPAPPVIPVGLATRLGLVGTALLGLAAALAPLLDGVGAGTSRHFATLSAVLAGLTILGRMLQSAAALSNAPQMAAVHTMPPTLSDDDLDGEPVALDEHEERDLHEADEPLARALGQRP